MRKVIFLDAGRCIGCKACEAACRVARSGPEGITVMPVGERFAVPQACRHCGQSMCLAVCPAGAVYKGEDLSVKIDLIKCIGCQLCIAACPFGVISLDNVTKTVKKCDRCCQRVKEGYLPACVATCPSGALTYEDLDLVTTRKRRKRALSSVLSCGQAGR